MPLEVEELKVVTAELLLSCLVFTLWKLYQTLKLCNW